MHSQSSHYFLRHRRESYIFSFSPNAQLLYQKRRLDQPNRFLEESPLQKNPNCHMKIANFINVPSILKTYLKSLVEIRVISITDSRKELWGQNGLFSLCEIPANKVLGIYTGIFMTEVEYTREYDREIVDAPNPIAAYAVQTDTK